MPPNDGTNYHVLIMIISLRYYKTPINRKLFICLCVNAKKGIFSFLYYIYYKESLIEFLSNTF